MTGGAMEKQGRQEIRLLLADEIECRAATVNEKGLSLLLYKDARVDQRILDETFGPFGWKRSHQCINGNLYCTVEIRDRESGEWVAKQDVGTTGYAEKEKSQASDSFKRACFNWGIGRELYTAPFIWIPAAKTQIQKKDTKYYCNDHFTVSAITYNSSRGISGLVIVNGRGATVYEWGGAGKAPKTRALYRKSRGIPWRRNCAAPAWPWKPCRKDTVLRTRPRCRKNSTAGLWPPWQRQNPRGRLRKTDSL